MHHLRHHHPCLLVRVNLVYVYSIEEDVLLLGEEDGIYLRRRRPWLRLHLHPLGRLAMLGRGLAMLTPWWFLLTSWFRPSRRNTRTR